MLSYAKYIYVAFCWQYYKEHNLDVKLRSRNYAVFTVSYSLHMHASTKGIIRFVTFIIRFNVARRVVRRAGTVRLRFT